MLDLYKKLESQERGEKREKWTQTEFLVFPFSIFLFLSSLSLSCKYSSLLTQEKQRQSFSCVCLLTENKKPFFLLTTLQEAILLKF